MLLTCLTTLANRKDEEPHLAPGAGPRQALSPQQTEGWTIVSSMVGRTIADLIDMPHVAEALQYRKREGD